MERIGVDGVGCRSLPHSNRVSAACRANLLMVERRRAQTGQKTSRLSLLEEDQRWRDVSWPISGQTDSMQEIAEAGLRAKGVGHRLHLIVEQTIVAFLISLFEPRQGCVFLAETRINRGKVKRRDIT